MVVEIGVVVIGVVELEVLVGFLFRVVIFCCFVCLIFVFVLVNKLIVDLIGVIFFVFIIIVVKYLEKKDFIFIFVLFDLIIIIVLFFFI